MHLICKILFLKSCFFKKGIIKPYIVVISVNVYYNLHADRHAVCSNDILIVWYLGMITCYKVRYVLISRWRRSTLE